MLLVATIAVVTGVGAALTLLMTRRGVLRTPDTTLYLGVMENFAIGRGITVPFVTYTEQYTPTVAAGFDGSVPLVVAGPVFPFAGGVLNWLGLSAVDAARVVNAAAVCAGLAVIGWCLCVLCERRWLVVLAGMCAILLAPAESTVGFQESFVGIAAVPQTEAVFIALSLVAVATLARYLATRRQGWAVALVTANSGVALTRYAGVSLALTAVVALLVLGWDTFARRARRAALVGGLSVVPLLVWNLANGWILGASSAREFQFHPPNRLHLYQSATGFASWFLPGSGGGLRLLALSVLAVVIVAVVARGVARLPRSVEARDDQAALLYRVLIVFTVVYAAVLLIARTFFDTFPLSHKYITPLQPVIFMLVITSVARMTLRLPASGRVVRVGTALVGVLALGVAWLGTPDLRTRVRDAWPDVTPLLERSPEARALRDLPDTPIASNLPDVVYNASGRFSINIPQRRTPTTGETNPDYEAEVRELGRLLRREQGTLVMYRGRLGYTFLPGRLGLVRTARFPSMDFYASPG